MFIKAENEALMGTVFEGELKLPAFAVEGASEVGMHNSGWPSPIVGGDTLIPMDWGRPKFGSGYRWSNRRCDIYRIDAHGSRPPRSALDAGNGHQWKESETEESWIHGNAEFQPIILL